MGNIVKYQDWPEWVKITTTFIFKKVLGSKGRTTAFVVGLISLLMAGYKIVSGLTGGDPNDWLSALGFVTIGGIYIICGKAIEWVERNSSWAERKAHAPSAKHKRTYVGVMAILLILSSLALRDVVQKIIQLP